jgi:hypothetical protein
MTSEEHYRQAEDLTDRTDVIGALPFEQPVEAQVHGCLELWVRQMRALSSLRSCE